MKFLLVEDNLEFASDVCAQLRELGFRPEHVTNKEDAENRLDQISSCKFFDLIVLDQNIPSTINSLDANVSHGRAVFHSARMKSPGTPLVILSARSLDDFLQDLLDESPHVDFWGKNEQQPLVNTFRKSNLDDFLDYARQIAEDECRLADIEIQGEDGENPLSKAEKKLIRIYGRRSNATQVHLSPISGGLSGASVLRANYASTTNPNIISTAIKFASITRLEGEAQKYVYFNRLAIGKYAPLISREFVGAGAHGGLVYRLAEGFDTSLLDCMDQAGTNHLELVEVLKDSTRPWHSNATATRRSIMDIRTDICGDFDVISCLSDLAAGAITSTRGAAQELLDLDLDQLEKREIDLRWGVQHSDLHCLNVLVSEQGDAILIDCGECRETSVSLDPITLELSFFFHPKAADRNVLRISLEDAKRWSRIEEFLGSYPWPEWARACRDWANDSGGGRRAVLATAYSYALRQLKYENNYKDVALGIAYSAAADLKDSFT